MKKFLLFLSASVLLALPKLQAQIIPNLGFETWTANMYSANNAPDPNNGIGTAGWWDFNVMSSALLGSSPITVYEGNANPAPESGSHYAEIVSNTMTTTSYNFLNPYGFSYPQINGLMYLGYVGINGISPVIKTGIPCNNRLQSFSFSYRYVPNGSDSCSCTIAIYHWNSVTKKRDVLGGANWGSTAKQTTWTSQTVNINYSPDSIHVMPDTVLIIFSACALGTANSPKQLDTLDIDNGSIVLAVNNIAAENANVKVYPNPANNEVNIAISGQVQANTVEIYDITGRLIGNYTMRNNSLTINTQSYNNGLYLYKVLNSTGTQLNVGKFSVVK